MRGHKLALIGIVALLVGVLGLIGAGTALAWGPFGGMVGGYGAGGMLGNGGTGGMMGASGVSGMMGGTGQGMMGGQYAVTAPTGPMTVSAAQAADLAKQWLAQNQPGSTIEERDQFYGYYTVHILRDGQPTGMLSVNGYTGQVWYHTWHGSFVPQK